ncbi:hypothetical protein ACFQL3_14355 [Natronoarchaeum sp. GCM10025321]|uniref:hypothetical protein n=1 Tax=Natronoarchaeum sp. GCM10025321 TaxID=3252684 RepID=UPI00361C6E7E
MSEASTRLRRVSLWPRFFEAWFASRASEPNDEKGGRTKSGETGLTILKNFVDICLEE